MNDVNITRTICRFQVPRAQPQIVALGVLLLLATVSLRSLGSEPKVDWQFTDIEGKLHKPFEAPSTRGMVLVFISTDCPIANSYQPLLRRLHDEYSEKGVRLFQVHADPQTSVETARKHATEYGIKSPILIDAEQSLARRVGATVTPEVVVLLGDENQAVYQGRIDNLYVGYGKKRQVASTNDLVDVLDRLVAGHVITPRRTKAIGCFISFENNEPKDSAEDKDRRVGD